ncbi:MAG: ribbon-helix-helix protein, CopG family [Terracidiphilus sp.]
MRNSKVVSVTLPPPLLAQARALAKEENRTMSELVREALRRYQRERAWDEIRAVGRAAAERAAVRSEDDVVRVIHELRREDRTARKKLRR